MQKVRAHTVFKTPDVSDFIAYENGEMSEEDTIEFFQKLIDTGMAWTLQGHYGRTATYLINTGRCSRPPPR